MFKIIGKGLWFIISQFIEFISRKDVEVDSWDNKKKNKRRKK